MTTITQTASELLEEIRSANENFEKNFANGDAKGMASLYTSDGMLLPPGAGVQEGSAAIQNFWQMVMDMGVKRAQLGTVHVEREGETAIEMGNYKLSGADDQRLDEGKYIVIWKQQDGDWKLHKDIWNTSLSAQP
jgi:uncharacterized protein (TIGR02246 family)